MKKPHWVVEIHVYRDVLLREFKELDTAVRCYRRLEDRIERFGIGPVTEIRLWHMREPFNVLETSRIFGS